MKKILSVSLLLLLAISIFAAPVSAATYNDGDIIYFQDFNSVTKVEDLGYDVNARARVAEYSPSENISIAIENKALKATAAAAKNGLFFIEILETSKIKDVEKFTIQYDLKVETASDDGNAAVGMIVYWDIAKGKNSGNLYACLQFRNAYKTFLNNGRNSSGWIAPFATPALTDFGVTNTGLNTTHKIKMEVNGSTITSYVDNKKIDTFTDAVVADGPISLLMYNNVDTSALVAVFDNIKIWAGNGPEPVAGGSTTTAPTTSPSTSSSIVPVIAVFGLTASALLIIKRKRATSK